MRLTAPWVLLSLLTGCAKEGPVGADSAASATAAFCANAPTLTWESYGQGFMATYCLACHSANARDRFGAPEDMNFDTAGETWSFQEQILSAVVETSTEPPGGGVYAEDKQALEAWLRCAEPGT